MTRTPTRDRFTPGIRIGDYKIERELRAEETGMVYAGVHLVLPRRAAVKVMHPAQAWMRSMAVQILREACILEALHHPGAPRVYECGVLADKRPWVAVELIEGETIAEACARQPLGVSELVVMIRAIADVLEHAHARGVVHHRLTARTIVRTPDRESPVCLRGWADVVAHDSSIAPDPSGDVRALGAIAFQGLTGVEAGEHSSAQHQAVTAPAELAALIDQMMSSDPGDRPSAAEVRERAAWLAQSYEQVAAPRGTPNTMRTAQPAARLRPPTAAPTAIAPTGSGSANAAPLTAPRTSTTDFAVRINALRPRES
jgi:serine/threonine protein kinase